MSYSYTELEMIYSGLFQNAAWSSAVKDSTVLKIMVKNRKSTNS